MNALSFWAESNQLVIVAKHGWPQWYSNYWLRHWMRLG